MKFLSIRGSTGLHMVQEVSHEPQKFEWADAPNDIFVKDESKNCRVMTFDGSGQLFAWSNGVSVNVAKLSSDKKKWSVISTLEQAKVSFLAFSPQGSILAAWEVFATKAGQTPQPNLILWDPISGVKKGSFIQRKSVSWCPQWSKNEEICCLRSQNNEVIFFKDNDFENVDKRLSLSRLDSFCLSPNGKQSHNIICFVPGQKGGPGFGKLYTYPNFHPEKDVVASKSFFQADRMETEWSHDGKMALLLTQSEVDKTGGSYYGKQQLHFMNANGETSMVQLAKDGPIYALKWSPVCNEFIVVYGYMPAKATLYNHKCEKIFDYGTGPRNMAIFNPQGNLMMLGGFGNLRGNTEIWSVKENKVVVKFEATDSTDLKWSPDGKLIMTATCAPRLRQGNGYKVWHYTGSLLYEKLIENASEELWEVQWQNVPLDQCPKFAVQYKAVEGIAPKQPQASKQAYRPPNMRNRVSNFKLHDEDEPAENQKKAETENLSKSAAKNKKRREAAKKKKDEEENSAPVKGNGTMQPSQKTSGSAPAGGQSVNSTVSSGNPEKDKKIRKLNDKLQQISHLKQQQKEGKKLELNQLEKLKKEVEFLEELRQLKL